VNTINPEYVLYDFIDMEFKNRADKKVVNVRKGVNVECLLPGKGVKELSGVLRMFLTLVVLTWEDTSVYIHHSNHK
jgi:hypothetical protein